IGPGGGRPHSTSSTRPAPRSYEHQRPTLDALRPGPERVVVTNANDLERPLYAQRDRVAGLPPEHAGLERRRIGGGGPAARACMGRVIYLNPRDGRASGHMY